MSGLNVKLLPALVQSGGGCKMQSVGGRSRRRRHSRGRHSRRCHHSRRRHSRGHRHCPHRKFGVCRRCKRRTGRHHRRFSRGGMGVGGFLYGGADPSAHAFVKSQVGTGNQQFHNVFVRGGPMGGMIQNLDGTQPSTVALKNPLPLKFNGGKRMHHRISSQRSSRHSRSGRHKRRRWLGGCCGGNTAPVIMPH